MYNKNYKHFHMHPNSTLKLAVIETCRSSQMYSHLTRRLEQISSVARDCQFTKYKRHICEEGEQYHQQ